MWDSFDNLEIYANSYVLLIGWLVSECHAIKEGSIPPGSKFSDNFVHIEEFMFVLRTWGV